MKKCHMNQKILASKNDSNSVFIWDTDKHKGTPSIRDSQFANQPDIT